MKGCCKMTYLSYEDKMKLLASAFQAKIDRLNSLPEDEAQKEARKELVKIGYVDADGNITAPYAALRGQYVQ